MTLILQVDPSTLSTAQQKGERVVCGHIQHFIKPKVQKSQDALYNAILTEWKKEGGKTTVVKVKKGNKLVYREVCVSPFAPKEPVILGGGFAFPFTSNTPKKKRASGKVMMVERPDLDNLIKGTQDALVYAGILPDDSQVAGYCNIYKYRSERPCVIIQLMSAKELG